MVGTFPLNVQAGSPQYTLTTPRVSSSLVTELYVTNPDAIEPISNAYYTIQNEDGSKWCTFYVSQWETTSANNYTGYCTYSSSNTTDVFPEGSLCWCVWTKEYYDSLTTYISNINIGIPSGCIIPYGGTTIPSGWLLCDGSSISTDTYPDLFNAIKYTYGGSGSSFNLPNLAGRMPLGVSGSYALGSTGGSETVTLTTAQIPSHTHTGSTSYTGNHAHSQIGGVPTTPISNVFASGNTSQGGGPVTTGVAGSHSHSLTINSAGGSDAHNNMPPYISLNYIIKT